MRRLSSSARVLLLAFAASSLAFAQTSDEKPAPEDEVAFAEASWEDDDEYLLHFTPEAGQSYRAEQVQEYETEVAVAGQQYDQIQEFTRTFTYDVHEDSDGDTVTLEVTPTPLRMFMDDPGGRQQFDTDEGQVPPRLRPMAAIANQTFIARAASTEGTVEVEGFEAVMEKARERIDDLPNPEQADAVQEQLETMFSESAMLEALEVGVRLHREEPGERAMAFRGQWMVEHPFP